MENVVLIVHLILALALIGVVLLQRSEGGGLGMGSSGGGGGMVSARGAATALGKVTWMLAIAFICTSLTLTIFAAQNSASGSVLDRIGAGGGAVSVWSTDGLDPEFGLTAEREHFHLRTRGRNQLLSARPEVPPPARSTMKHQARTQSLRSR